MELFGWAFGLIFSLFGLVWALLRHPFAYGKLLGLLPPAVWVVAMAGVYGWARQAGSTYPEELGPMRYAFFFMILPIGSGVVGLVLALWSERQRTRQRQQRALERIEQVHGAGGRSSEGPFR
jgi:hypothetical protein